MDEKVADAHCAIIPAFPLVWPFPFFITYWLWIFETVSIFILGITETKVPGAFSHFQQWYTLTHFLPV